MRLPLIPTVLVALAVAAMIGLGVWQLDRRQQKEAMLAQLADNPAKPPVAFPRPGADAESLLFRRSGLFCLEPVSWTSAGGMGVNGRRGWRQIATCRTGVEGPGAMVDIGVAADPRAKPQWRGGEVTGRLAHAPDSRPSILKLFAGERAPSYMLVADQPLAGLEPTQPPAPDSIPNNHLAYAVQWFLFAAAAVVIYLLALRWRDRSKQ